MKIYSEYLRQLKRGVKHYYSYEVAKYKNDIRNIWDTFKDMMNKKNNKKSKVEFPTYFLNNGKHVSVAKISLTNSMNI